MNRPLDFDRLERSIREKYQLDQLDDPAREFDRLRERAAAGDAEAEFALGLYLAYGDGEAGDPALAAGMFARAAQAGVVRAQTELGRLYLSGVGMPADPARAAQLFAAAWQAGDPEGAFLLATGKRLNLFPGADPAQAPALLASAAERGHVAAARALYGLAKNGELPAPDPRLGTWLQAAADTGDAGALVDLAELHLRAQEGEKAFAVFEVAAEAGSAHALSRLMQLSRASLRDPAVRARLQGMFELHTANPGNSGRIAYQALAFLELFAADRAAATARARADLEQAGTRGSYQARVAVQLLDRGKTLPEALREATRLKNDAAYARSIELARESAPSNSNGIMPRPVKVVQPAFPAELVADHLSGQATVRLVVRADGSVTDVEVVSASHPAFGFAAATAVAEWQFTPGQKNGEKVNTVVQIPMQFRAPED
ncbi:MAG: TonB family protein [Opitutaceae bacterium]